MYLVIGGNINRIGFQDDRLRCIHGTLDFHRDVKTAHHIVAIHIQHIRVLITSNRISRTVYPIPVGFLNGKIQDPDLTETGSSVFVYDIEEGVLQLRRRIGVAALHFRQYAGLFSSGLVAYLTTFTTVTYRVAHPIDFVGIFSRFYIVELQIGQPILGTHAFEIKLVPLTVRSNMYRHTIVGIGHDDSIGQHLQSYPTSVVGVAALAVISYRSVMPIVVRFVYQEDRLSVRSLQLRPTTGTLGDIVFIRIRPEISTRSTGKNENFVMHFPVTRYVSRILRTTPFFTEIPVSVAGSTGHEVHRRDACQHHSS